MAGGSVKAETGWGSFALTVKEKFYLTRRISSRMVF
jgi:hypothetical protein